MPEGKRTDHKASANEVLRQQFNALLAKLDADAGVTDTDFESTLKVTLKGES